MKNLCPVCGFEMEDPPANFNICPCCGTEFGLHDQNASLLELRQNWIAGGLRWWSNTDAVPEDFDPYRQLRRLDMPRKGTR